jgi:FdhE protein
VSARTETQPWVARRRRAEELRERHSFAEEVLTLYLALLPVQEDAWRAARESAPPPGELAGWAANRVLPGVIEATVESGPPTLGEAVRDYSDNALAYWLAGEDLDPVDRYVARASLAPALEGLGEPAVAPATSASCPRCGGVPQLSWLAASGDSLVTGRRSLLCSRCAWSWDHTRSACPACGEDEEERLVVYTERWQGAVSGNGNGDGPVVFPNVQIAGCTTCRRYLLEVDMARDAHAVPEVDELAAIPLALYAADLDLEKVTTNLMGF